MPNLGIDPRFLSTPCGIGLPQQPQVYGVFMNVNDSDLYNIRMLRVD